MYDLHCHILNGIDDGAKTLEDSLAMAKAAESEGITHIVATPHHNVRDWQNPKAIVEPLVEELNHNITEAGINLQVSAGQEVRLSGDLVDQIDSDQILFLDKNRHYLLIEFPTQTVPTYTEHLFYQLYSKEIIPVIAHPERNHAIYDNPNILHRLVSSGALAQITSSSFTGDFGKKIEKFTHKLIEANLVHILASDAHNVTNRPFNFKKAMDKLEKKYGNETKNKFVQNSQSIVNGKIIQTKDPLKVSSRRFFGLF